MLKLNSNFNCWGQYRKHLGRYYSPVLVNCNEVLQYCSIVLKYYNTVLHNVYRTIGTSARYYNTLIQSRKCVCVCERERERERERGDAVNLAAFCYDGCEVAINRQLLLISINSHRKTSRQGSYLPTQISYLPTQISYLHLDLLPTTPSQILKA